MSTIKDVYKEYLKITQPGLIEEAAVSVGMTLKELQRKFPEATEATWHQHSNGGGWVENTATVTDTAFVGPEALVSGNAKVSGDERIN